MNHHSIVLSRRSSQGMMDSLSRTSDAERIFDEKEELEKGVKSYFSSPQEDSPERGQKIFVCRYPFDSPWLYAKGNSRDHILKAVANRKILGDHQWVKIFLKYRAKRPRISKGYTPLQKLWMLTLYSKTGSWIWTIAKTIEMVLLFLLTSLGRTMSWTWRTWENPEAFCKDHEDNTGYKHLNKWQKFWVGQWCVLPMFAIAYTVPMIQALESKWANRYMGFLVRLLFVEKHNYVLRKMLGQKRVPFHYQYKCSRANRWGMRLDNACDRDMTIYNDSPGENIEMGMYYKWILESN